RVTAPSGGSGMSTHGSSSSDKGLAEATQRTLEGAQLARLAGQLRDLGHTRDLARALGDDPDQYASRLAAQYKDLSLKMRLPGSPRVVSQAARLTATLD